ncbi:MAG TPA: hypothetical protein VMH90_04015 [Thermoplasmata archaeon]|nr:hypothetical protein [Thermoplasmata archaeon]
MAPEDPRPEYGTCRVCGDAVPPGAATCPICGASDPIRADQIPELRGARKHRFRLLQYGRSVVVIAVVVGLALLLVQAAFTPPPVANNPLTQQTTLTVAPGHFLEIAGAITGADYIQGNFTVLNPPGANLTFEIFNSTEFPTFDIGGEASPMQPSLTGSSERIVYAALYTDTYYFVWINNYPASSGLNLTFYVTTTYETNVVVA